MRAQHTGDPGRLAFVQDCAEKARRYLDTYDTASNLRVIDVRALPNRIGHPIKLGVVFTQDRHQRVTFGYWTFVWEQVAWSEKYRLPTTDDSPAAWVEEFIRDWDETFEFQDALAMPHETDEAGVRWIRAALVWG